MPRTEPTGRRRFLKWFLGTSLGALAAAVLYPVLRYLQVPEDVEASVDQMEAGPVNAPEFVDSGYKIIRFGNEPVIVIRVAADDFRAFAGTCTHLDCIVEFQRDRERIWCNCHNGIYNLRGQVVSGPPPRPLDSFDVHLTGDAPQTVVVSRRR
ncbi:MAG: ubiquinol-cytochrome c reductase iron-sulfur subunit [Candidatus Krumholzibacteriia bacterium]